MPRVEPALAQRLEALDASCCAADYRDMANAARRAGGFDLALLRAKAMGDERRLTALALLKRQGEMCGCQLQAALDLTHGTVSHHMAQLEEARLVESQRRGRWIYYALTKDAKELVP